MDSFFPEIHVTFIDCVGDEPDLKLGSHFERVALGITTARSCVLVRGARDGFAAVALKPPPCLGHCLGEKTSPSTPSLWPAWRSFASTVALEGKRGVVIRAMGNGDWIPSEKLAQVPESCMGPACNFEGERRLIWEPPQ